MLNWANLFNINAGISKWWKLGSRRRAGRLAAAGAAARASRGLRRRSLRPSLSLFMCESR